MMKQSSLTSFLKPSGLSPSKTSSSSQPDSSSSPTKIRSDSSIKKASSPTSESHRFTKKKLPISASATVRSTKNLGSPPEKTVTPSASPPTSISTADNGGSFFTAIPTKKKTAVASPRKTTRKKRTRDDVVVADDDDQVDTPLKKRLRFVPAHVILDEVENEAEEDDVANDGMADDDDALSDKNDDESDECADDEKLKEHSRPFASQREPKKPQRAKNVRVHVQHDVLKDAGWSEGTPVPYLALSNTFDKIANVGGRIEKTEILANFLRSVIALTPEDLLPCMYLMLGQVGAVYEGLELGVGESLLIKAVCDCAGRNTQRVKEDLQKTGDIGVVAAESKRYVRTMFPPPPLLVRNVFQTLKDIALSSGIASRDKKQSKINKLYVSCRETESKYIMRTLRGKFRIGLSNKTLQSSLALAYVQTPPEKAAISRSSEGRVLDTRKSMSPQKFEESFRVVHDHIIRAYSQVPNYDIIIPTLLEVVTIEDLLKNCAVRPGMPIFPMLAQPSKGFSEVVSRFERHKEITCEFKYDGERAQIHLMGDSVTKVYSRSLEDTTGKYPDVVENMTKAVKPGVTSYIIDCEAVAFDREKNELMPFQILSHRSRKTVDIADVKIRVCIFAFDIMYLNGESCLDLSLVERRKKLIHSFNEVDGLFSFATFENMTDLTELERFLKEAVDRQCEGLMVKALKEDSQYQPGERPFSWLKVKKDYIQGMTDSLDLVVIGAWFGTGKRTGVYGAFLLACYDDDEEAYQPICKVGTGLSDEDLEKHHRVLKEHSISSPRPYYQLSDGFKSPEVWFDPVQVWEVKAADMTISPQYTAAKGLIDSSKGISLRFPRFLRVRDDKAVQEATSSSRIAHFYRQQNLKTENSHQRIR